MDVQQNFWKLLYTTKHDCYYLEEYLSSDRKYEYYINLFTAIASCSSIAGWAIWKNLDVLWSIIIASSQVINAIKHKLPFSNRIKIIVKMLEEMSNLHIKIDSDWYYVRNSFLTEEEIHMKLIKHKEKYSRILDLANKTLDIPESSKFEQIAMDKTKQYYMS